MPPPLIKVPKLIRDSGQWKSGKVPPNAFPLNAPLAFSSKWKWRSVRLTTLQRDADARLLIAYNGDKGQYRAYFGQEMGGKIAVLACLEDHGTHPGLHCHAPCGKRDKVPAGSLRYGQPRAPLGRSMHRRLTPEWNDRTAWQAAMTFFRVDDRPEGSML